MILLLDSSSADLHLFLYDTEGNELEHRTISRGRELARQILGDIERLLNDYTSSLHDMSGIGVYRGPGSFTGLRIGITVANTLADSLQIPICGASGDDWQEKCVMRLIHSENDKAIAPIYGAMPHITAQKK